MELLSDFCPASGDGFAGYVDTDVCFDDIGLPYIPAKRLKGVLRECGLDILSVDGNYSKIFATLFGETGNLISGTLNIGNGKLQNYDDIIARVGNAHTSELAEVYTSVRSRTKIDGGKAAVGTLRTARVLNKGQVYEFPVTLSDVSDDGYIFLKMCVQSLRGLGLNRSRGLGEVKCKLIDSEQSKGVRFSIEKDGDKSSFSYSLELLEPVISAQRSGKPFGTEDYIFGSAVLGAFAVKYIEKFIPNRNEAYKDKNFRRIFLEGGVKFSASMPWVNGFVYYPAPSVLRTDKSGKRLFDESAEAYDDKKHDKSDDDKKNPICKRLGGFIKVDENRAVTKLSPTKITFPHHARPKDRSIAHATENDGSFYTYEALSVGQTFIGNVTGNAEDISILADLFADDSILQLGRSRTAQYGKVKISSASVSLSANLMPLCNGDTFRLVVVTPIILDDGNGINKTDINLLCDSLGYDFEIVRSACSETVVSGYYGKWLLPRRQERAIAEGSTVVLKYTGGGTTLDLNYIGKRTGEGFGQIRLETVPVSDAFTLAKASKVVTSNSSKLPAEIENLRTSKSAIAAGAEYGECCYATAPNNASLSLILTALKEATSFDHFAKLLGNIKQKKKKESTLSFATGEGRRYFQTNAKRLEPKHIAQLIEQRGQNGKAYGNYETYQKFLNAAAHRIKQKRRSIDKTKEGGEPK
jgi:CRISPR-associated protein Csx10